MFRFLVGEGFCWLSPRFAECLEISRRRNGVVVAHILRAVNDDIRHRAEDDAARISSCRQEIGDVAFAPVAKRIRTTVAQARREIILDRRTGQEFRTLGRRLRPHLHYEVARRVALPAMAETFYEIGAARDGWIALCLSAERCWLRRKQQ